MRFRAAKDLPKYGVTSGQLVEIELRTVADAMLADGSIIPWKRTHRIAEFVGVAAKPYVKTKRVGIWLHTSMYYSGGRVHLYQIALGLAQLGAEVYLITDGVPKWSEDYPKNQELHLIIEGGGKIPPDLDVILTDSKGAIGTKSLEYKEAHPHVPFVCLNFETPNWVAEFVPGEAKHMPHKKEVFEQADFLLANSGESAKWLKEWLGFSKNHEVGIIPPAANTHAISIARSAQTDSPKRPYAVWSARSAAYKGGKTAIDAIKSLPMPFDLVMIGQPPGYQNDDPNHVITHAGQIDDIRKFDLLRHATMVIAPSLFEGYGMVPMEALCCGTPVIAYDLPVLQQEYGDLLIYAKWGDAEDFKSKVLHVAECATRHAEDGSPTLNELVASSAGDCVECYGLEAQKTKIDAVPHFHTKRKTVTAQMICYYGPTVQEALEGIYPHVDQILIAHGPTELWKDVPADNSLELIRSFPDPDGKIQVEARSVWRDKLEMRDWCGRHAYCNHMLIVDADEIYIGLDKWLANDINFGCPTWVHFWHDLEHYVVDAPGMTRWGAALERGCSHWHYRWSQWRGSYRFKKHCMAYDANGEALSRRKQTEEAVKKCPDCMIYHLGHVLSPQLMQAKHAFYKNRDGNDDARKARESAWHNWDGSTGDCGDGIIKDVNWEIPELVKRAYERIK